MDLFRKWGSEGTLLRCDFTFGFFAACFRGRVALTETDRIEIRSDDKTSELVMPIVRGLTFVYAEPEPGVVSDEVFEGGLVAMFPSTDPTATPDCITFLVIL